MDTLDKYIQVFDGILPPDVCDRVINEYANTDEWSDALVGNYGLDKSIRNLTRMPISTETTILKNKEIRSAIDADIFKGAAKVIAKYNELINCNVKRDVGYDLLRYNVGEFYRTHTDSDADNMRTLSCSFALNDDYDGGEWDFFDGEIKIKLKKGSAIVFPANFLYPHAINTITRGTRFSIITWFV